MRPLALIALAFLLAPLGAQADVYRWVDSRGEVHYSDRPVEGAVLVKTASPRPPSPSDAAPSRVAATPNVATPGSPEPENRAGRTARALDLARKRAEGCTEAKPRHEKSRQARRIFRTLENGERESLPDAEADQVRVTNRAAMDAACGPAPRASR